MADFLTYLLSRHPEAPKTFLAIGGLDIKEQRKKMLVCQAPIVIGTPGRVKEMLIDREWLDVSLLHTLIIDEADKFC